MIKIVFFHTVNIGYEPKFCKSLPNSLCPIVFHHKVSVFICRERVFETQCPSFLTK